MTTFSIGDIFSGSNSYGNADSYSDSYSQEIRRQDFFINGSIINNAQKLNSIGKKQ